MSSSSEIVLAFDLYGTILSTASIAEALAEHLGKEKAAEVAATWRTLQLEYTWRLNSMEQYQPFSTVTASSLSSALAAHNTSLSDAATSTVLQAYETLHPFPDVPDALQTLCHTSTSETSPALKPYILTNGTSTQAARALSSPALQEQTAHIFTEANTISTDEVRAFKPAPSVYWHLLARAGKAREQAGEVWLVSGNAFDVVGAKSLGLRACWVDRGGRGWTDRLVPGEAGMPDLMVGELGEVVERVRAWVVGK